MKIHHLALCAVLLAAPLHAQTTQTESVEQLSIKLFNIAPKTGHAGRAIDLLEKGADPNRVFSGTGATSLHRAAEKCHEKMLDALLRYGGNPKLTDAKGFSPLFYASWAKESLDVGGNCGRSVALLLQYGPDPNERFDGKTLVFGLSGGETVLYLTAKEHTTAVGVEALLKAGADPNRQSVKSQTPLHAAIGSRDEVADKVAVLLNSRADPNLRDSDGQSPLHYAATLDNQSLPVVVPALVGDGADPNLRDSDGNTPLHMLANNGPSREDVEVMLAQGADPCIENNAGLVPHAVALRYGQSYGSGDRYSKLFPDSADCRRESEAESQSALDSIDLGMQPDTDAGQSALDSIDLGMQPDTTAGQSALEQIDIDDIAREIAEWRNGRPPKDAASPTKGNANEEQAQPAGEAEQARYDLLIGTWEGVNSFREWGIGNPSYLVEWRIAITDHLGNGRFSGTVSHMSLWGCSANAYKHYQQLDIHYDAGTDTVEMTGHDSPSGGRACDGKEWPAVRFTMRLIDSNRMEAWNLGLIRALKDQYKPGSEYREEIMKTYVDPMRVLRKWDDLLNDVPPFLLHRQ